MTPEIESLGNLASQFELDAQASNITPAEREFMLTQAQRFRNAQYDLIEEVANAQRV
jgi:hypothetical protein